MTADERRYAVTGAVLFGSLLLFGPLLFVVVNAVATDLVDAIVGPPSGIAVALLFPVWFLLPAAVAYVTVVEAARVQLHGYDELRRGTRRRRLVRHALLATGVVSSLVAASRVTFNALTHGLEYTDPVVFALGAALVLALSWVLLRSAGAFTRGVRQAS